MSDDQPLRIAVVGSGPAGFYVVQHLFRQAKRPLRIDMFDRLITPFGLVRHGVAPDHPKIKSVVAVYDKLARQDGFRFFGNVEFGRDVDLELLGALYDQVVFATGAQTDRRLGIPGEDLAGSHPATEFVAWYNGHPDFREAQFDLSCERAVVIGVGNVAVDVARVLCRTPDRLAETDIADHALAALRRSSIREVLLVGRRGPAQAAFTNPEVKELGELEGAVARTRPDEVELDPLTAAALTAAPDRTVERKVAILRAMADAPDDDARPRRLWIRFLQSPVELVDDGRGRVGAIRLARTELVAGEGGAIRARTTDDIETVDCGLVFRSVGYRGVALAGVEFDERRGVVPNAGGRVLDAAGSPRPGLYVAGWIKRGPSGVIGTNKPDAGETVSAMLDDADAGRLAPPPACDPDAIERALAGRGVRAVSYDDWLRLDAEELRRGAASGRPRAKLIDPAECLAWLDRPVD